MSYFYLVWNEIIYNIERRIHQIYVIPKSKKIWKYKQFSIYVEVVIDLICAIFWKISIIIFISTIRVNLLIN